MKHIYEKTVTSVFIVPTIPIDREDLYKNKFINGFIADLNKDEYYDEDVIFLLFKPNNLDLFRKYLNKEYENNKFIVEDYDYDNGYIIVVYQLNSDYKEDIELIKQSKYSKVSQKFKNLFPKRLINHADPKKESVLSIQHLIFNRDERLIEFWEKQFNTEINDNVELWNEFNLKNEILDIEKIIENDKFKESNK